MKTERKPRKKTNFRENMGKLMLDLGKLVFAGMFIAGIIQGELPTATIIFSGLGLAVVGFIFGIIWTTKEDKTTEDKE